ncbi:MAG: thioredoxin fold domain-containing protein [Candidatus Aminicenantes bacterium]|nr:MAG: thioredoxin fold domain-containing protein [Candidatus Aminicenantes bacterium]
MADKMKVSCLVCGSTNYYPLDAGGKKVICGRCKSPLPHPGEVIEPTPEQVNTLIQKSFLPVLIDFFSPTCAPCQMMHPIVHELAKRRAGELMVMQVDMNKHAELGASFGVQGVPTFIIFSKGFERARTSGAMSETDFSLWIASKI